MDESPSPDPFSSSQQQPVRRHGLELPLNAYQIGSWIIFFFESCILYVIFLPPLSFVLKLVSGIVITIFMLVAFFNAYKAMITDPTDPKVYQERTAITKGEDYQTDLRHFCVICNAHVQPRTKHCGQCNRCTETFDHHCIWLNNCIGEQNYRYFMKAVVSLFLAVTVKLGFGIYIVINYNKFINDFDKYASEFFNTDGNFSALHVISIVSVAINALLWLLLLKLLTLHIWLAYKGLTTYESIMIARENKEEMEAMEQRRPKKKKKSKTIKHLDEESYIGNSTFSGKSAFQTATGVQIDLEDSGQEKSKPSKSGRFRSKKKQDTEKKETHLATFSYTDRKEVADKKVESLGRSESNFNNPPEDRSRHLEKQDSSISVAMLNAEPSSFIGSEREYKFQESVLEEEEKSDNIIDVLKGSALNDTPPKKQQEYIRQEYRQEKPLEERSQPVDKREVNKSVSRSVSKSQSRGLFGSRSNNKISRIFSSDTEGSFGINRSSSQHQDTSSSGLKDLKSVAPPVKNYKKIDIFGQERSDSQMSHLTTINASGIQAIHAQMQKDNTEYIKKVSYNHLATQTTTISKMETNIRPDTKELDIRINSVRSSAINLDEPEAATQSFQSNGNQTRKSVSF